MRKGMLVGLMALAIWVASALVFVQCKSTTPAEGPPPDPPKNVSVRTGKSSGDFTEVVIDKCHYIIWHDSRINSLETGSGWGGIVHKGNCPNHNALGGQSPLSR